MVFLYDDQADGDYSIVLRVSISSERFEEEICWRITKKKWNLIFSLSVVSLIWDEKWSWLMKFEMRVTEKRSSPLKNLFKVDFVLLLFYSLFLHMIISSYEENYHNKRLFFSFSTLLSFDKDIWENFERRCKQLIKYVNFFNSSREFSNEKKINLGKSYDGLLTILMKNFSSIEKKTSFERIPRLLMNKSYLLDRKKDQFLFQIFNFHLMLEDEFHFISIKKILHSKEWSNSSEIINLFTWIQEKQWHYTKKPTKNEVSFRVDNDDQIFVRVNFFLKNTNWILSKEFFEKSIYSLIVYRLSLENIVQWILSTLLFSIIELQSEQTNSIRLFIE